MNAEAPARTRPEAGRGNAACALSVDVEEWCQTVLFEGGPRDDGARTRLPESVSGLLALLERRGVKATFFFVGALVEKYPETVLLVAARGHELASHGWRHRLVHRMGAAEFEEDVRRSVEALRRVSGAEVVGYRAPTWSLGRHKALAAALLPRLGLRYDSSLYPLGFRPDAERFPRTLPGGLLEFPPSTFRLLGANLPFAGGTFLRCAPTGFILERLRALRAAGRPVHAFAHSWELEGPAPEGLPAWKRWVQYGNVAGVRGKLEALLEAFPFSPVRECLGL
ncbi:MAG: polysaccharide deacetylase family protein [Elusimicrobiota bacterium]